MRKMTLIAALAAATWSVALPTFEQTLYPRQRPWDFLLFWDIPAGAVRDRRAPKMPSRASAAPPLSRRPSG